MHYMLHGGIFGGSMSTNKKATVSPEDLAAKAYFGGPDGASDWLEIGRRRRGGFSNCREALTPLEWLRCEFYSHSILPTLSRQWFSKAEIVTCGSSGKNSDGQHTPP